MRSRFFSFSTTKTVFSVVSTSITFYRANLRYITLHPAKTLITILNLFSYIEAVGVNYQIQPTLQAPQTNDMSFVQHIALSSYDILTNTKLNEATLAGAQYYLFAESHNNFTHRELEVKLIHELGIAGDMIFIEGRVNMFPCESYCVLANNRLHTGVDRSICMPGIHYDKKFICSGWESPAHAAYAKKIDSLLHDLRDKQNLLVQLTPMAEKYFQLKKDAYTLVKKSPHQALYNLHQSLKIAGMMYKVIDNVKYNNTFEQLKKTANQAAVIIRMPATQMDMREFKTMRVAILSHLSKFEDLYFELSAAYQFFVDELQKNWNVTRIIQGRNRDGLIPKIKASRSLKHHKFFISGHMHYLVNKNHNQQGMLEGLDKSDIYPEILEAMQGSTFALVFFRDNTSAQIETEILLKTLKR